MPLRLTLFSGELATKARAHTPLRGALEGGTNPCTQCRGLHTPEAPHAPRSFTTNAQAPRISNHQLNRLGFQEPKSNKHSSFYSNESSPRTQTDAPNAMARTHEVLKSFSPKFHQSYKSLWGNKRGRTKKENTKFSKFL